MNKEICLAYAGPMESTSSAVSSKTNTFVCSLMLVTIKAFVTIRKLTSLFVSISLIET